MTILSSQFPSGTTREPISVAWIACRLRRVSALPTWRVLLFSAVRNTTAFLYRPALLDYATAFVIYMELFLNQVLTRTFRRKRVTAFLLKEHRDIQERVTKILKFATGKSLGESGPIFTEWKAHVQEPRNALSHGKVMEVGPDEVERAHQAVCQAIRWIEHLKAPTTVGVS